MEHISTEICCYFVNVNDYSEICLPPFENAGEARLSHTVDTTDYRICFHKLSSALLLFKKIVCSSGKRIASDVFVI